MTDSHNRTRCPTNFPGGPAFGAAFDRPLVEAMRRGLAVVPVGQDAPPERGGSAAASPGQQIARGLAVTPVGHDTSGRVTEVPGDTCA